MSEEVNTCESCGEQRIPMYHFGIGGGWIGFCSECMCKVFRLGDNHQPECPRFDYSGPAADRVMCIGGCLVAEYW